MTLVKRYLALFRGHPDLSLTLSQSWPVQAAGLSFPSRAGGDLSLKAPCLPLQSRPRLSQQQGAWGWKGQIQGT